MLYANNTPKNQQNMIIVIVGCFSRPFFSVVVIVSAQYVCLARTAIVNCLRCQTLLWWILRMALNVIGTLFIALSHSLTFTLSLSGDHEKLQTI